jgi:hypothetical protein
LDPAIDLDMNPRRLHSAILAVLISYLPTHCNVYLLKPRARFQSY